MQNKVVVITGGAGYLGAHFAKVVLAHGGIAVIADINLEAAESLGSRLAVDFEAKNIVPVSIDIVSKDSVESLIANLHSKFGRIDALVNNAYPRNRNYGRKFFEVEISDFNANLNMHLGGYFLTSQQFSKYFLKQGYGNIVNISSIYGLVAPRFELYDGTDMSMPVEYAAIKSGVNHLTRYMAKNFKDANIRVNTLSPGGIFNNQPPTFLAAYKNQCTSKGMLDPEDIGGGLAFLLSDSSKYVNGQNLVIDDGFSL